MRRFLLLLLTFAATAAAAGVSAAATGRLMCGSERWPVKTLQDRPRLKPTKDTTIAALVALPKINPLPQPRLADEFSVYRVAAQVTLVRHEDDDDLHLVIEDAAGNHMIAEVPAAACTGGATALRRRQMGKARAAATTCTKAVMIGVLFHDFFHHQAGVAPNVIELHPLLSFRCITP